MALIPVYSHARDKITPAKLHLAFGGFQIFLLNIHFFPGSHFSSGEMRISFFKWEANTWVLSICSTTWTSRRSSLVGYNSPYFSARKSKISTTSSSGPSLEYGFYFLLTLPNCKAAQQSSQPQSYNMKKIHLLPFSGCFNGLFQEFTEFLKAFILRSNI